MCSPRVDGRRRDALPGPDRGDNGAGNHARPREAFAGSGWGCVGFCAGGRFGENDHVTPVSVIPPLREQFDAHGIPYSLEAIAGADHGFTMRGMPAYERDAAERAWVGTLLLLGERMGGSAAATDV